MATTTHSVDLDRLLKLRLIVARFGEMDIAKWWNTKGQLGHGRPSPRHFRGRTIRRKPGRSSPSLPIGAAKFSICPVALRYGAP